MNECRILFSIIVPCYEIGRYAGKMLASIQEQTFGNFECLLVYEESSDNTLELCQKAVESDSRFRLFQGPRTGSGSVPRNVGMQNAQGEYVLFVDGDDWIEKEALERFAAAIEKNGQVDLIAASSIKFTEKEDGSIENVRECFNFLPEDDGRIFTGKEATVYLGKLHSIVTPALCRRVYRIDFLRTNGLHFIPGIIDEDEEWSPRVLFLAGKVLVMDYPFYIYRFRPGSVTTSLKVRDLHAMSLVMRSLFAFYVQHRAELTPEVAYVWQRSWLSLFFLLFFAPHNQHGITERVRRTELRNLLAEEGLGNFKEFMRMASFSKRATMPLILLGRWTTVPAVLYFKWVYYPLVDLREAVRRRFRKKALRNEA